MVSHWQRWQSVLAQLEYHSAGDRPVNGSAIAQNTISTALRTIFLNVVDMLVLTQIAEEKGEQVRSLGFPELAAIFLDCLNRNGQILQPS